MQSMLPEKQASNANLLVGLMYMYSTCIFCDYQHVYIYIYMYMYVLVGVAWEVL